MSPPVRDGMAQVARRASGILGESASLVRGFLLKKQNPDGGFPDRAGRSDLYYTVFGLEALLAMQATIPAGPTRSYLDAFGDGGGLDFAHLCCLARCRAIFGCGEEAGAHAALASRIESHRAADGGYHPAPGSPSGTAYAAFLALGAHQDLLSCLPDPDGLARSLRPLAMADGGWANELPAKLASTNSTAAALAVLGSVEPLSDRTKPGRWLLAQSHPLGGFRASPLAPIPDLLSTATALHAISALGLPIAPAREPCLDFIDSLWTNEGGFHGHWQDDTLDVEYTFYGLLALGHLAG
ncbi:MAG: prenyltransferase/squalene oxidase repeat-containing protein [Verrucomicrobiae bacterium]